MMRCAFAVAAVLWAHVAIAAPPPGCDHPVAVNELVTDYTCAGNLHAVTSDGAPANIPDGRGGWRAPVLTWQRGPVGYELATLPGPLVYRAERDWLIVEDRSGVEQGRIAWAITGVDGAAAHFVWAGHPCTLTAERYGLKLACAITEHLGQATLGVAARGAWSIDADRGATAGRYRLPAPVLIAGETDYHNLAHWRVGADSLEIVLDDRSVPVPYVLDPATSATYPGTCATATGVGTIAWTNPTNAQTSNDSRATSALTLSAQSNWLKCTNYGFTTTPLSDDKVIKGIVSEAEVQQSGSSIKIQDIRAVKAGTIQTTSRATGGCITNWTSTDSQRSCGGSTDLWGTTWAPSDVRDSGFGVALSAKNNNTTTTRTASVDAIRVTIYYSPPAGRVYLTGWDTWGTEDGTATVAGSSTITYPAGAKRTGNAGLRITTAANSAANWCVALDTDITNRAYVRPYIVNANPIAAGTSLIVGYLKHDDGNVGCYALLTRDTAGQYSVQMKFHGLETTDLNFGTYPISETTLTNYALTFGQVIEGDGVACPLYFGGELVQAISLAMVGDCSGGACDIASVCLGTPATTAVDDYTSIPATTLDLDDLAVDNLVAPTIGKVQPLFPDAACALSTDCNTWSNNGTPTGYQALQDFSTGVAGGCLSTSGDSQRARASGSAIDIYQIDELPALAATDTVEAVRFLGALCTKTGTSVASHLYAKQCASDASCASGSTYTGTDTSGADETAFTLYSTTFAEDLTNTGTAWTESVVNALHIGTEKTGTGKETRQTALLAYAEVANVVPPPDQNMQDWNGDGQISVVFRCDSITAGTKSSVCVGSANCAEACTADTDCQTGGTCTNSLCSYPCERTEDCSCGAGAICFTSIMWVNQLSSKLQQADNLVNCGRNTMPLRSWWADVMPSVLVNPYSHASPDGPCSLVRGAWGYCSSTSSVSCAVDADCPSGQTCNPNEPDYVADLCGGNDLIGLAPGDCTVVSGLVPDKMDRWKRQSCPQAKVAPSGYATTRTTCTVNGDCPAGSACKGYCESHTDPLWSCRNDADCGTCADDATKFCYHQGSCQDDNNCLVGGTCCNVDADCPATTGCTAYSALVGAWDSGTWGLTCATCDHHDCKTDVKYCVAQCSDVNCSTDADCGVSGGTGGVCNTGTGKCRACGNSTHYTGTRDGSFDLLVNKRLASIQAYTGTAERLITAQNALSATVDAAPGRRVVGTYAMSFQNGVTFDTEELFVKKAQTELRSLENVVDLHNAIRTRDDRNANTNGVILIDGVHNFTTGASAVGDLWNSYLSSLYPVCTLDTSKPCAFCDVACTTDTQCNKPVVGTSPTPTPKAGACRTATPAVNVCGCTSDSDCATGLTCRDINSGAGTDNRCVSYDVDLCPVGNDTSARKLLANDYTCSAQSAGTCDKERTRPRCTNRQEVECSTSTDCLGITKGDICAADGVLLPCKFDFECRDAGVKADDVCAAATPVIGTSPTPKSKWCTQRTPTPTP